MAACRAELDLMGLSEYSNTGIPICWFTEHYLPCGAHDWLLILFFFMRGDVDIRI